ISLDPEERMSGRVEEIFVTREGSAAMESVEEVDTVEGGGIKGAGYCEGGGAAGWRRVSSPGRAARRWRAWKKWIPWRGAASRATATARVRVSGRGTGTSAR